MYNVKSLKAEEFISDEEIKETLEYAEANKNNIGLIDKIIEKAKLKKGLTHRSGGGVARRLRRFLINSYD